MMKVVFDVNDFSLRDTFLRTFFFGALDALTPDLRPRWGLMTAQQMVEHLVWTFEVSTGRAEVECPTPEDQIEHLKKFLYRNRPTPQEFMNPALTEGLPALRYPDLRQARTAFSDRYMEETLERELRRAQRNNLPLSVITIDVDNLTQGDNSVGNTGNNATVAGATGDRANANTGDDATQNSGDGAVTTGGNATVRMNLALAYYKSARPNEAVALTLNGGSPSARWRANSPSSFTVRKRPTIRCSLVR